MIGKITKNLIALFAIASLAVVGVYFYFNQNNLSADDLHAYYETVPEYPEQAIDFVLLIENGRAKISDKLPRYFNETNSAPTTESKLEDAAMSSRLKANFSERELARMYLDKLYYGRECRGLDGASTVYFDKASDMLSTSEVAFLIAIVIAPSTYQSADRAQPRRDYVLSEALEAALISESEYEVAIAEPLILPDASKQCDAL